MINFIHGHGHGQGPSVVPRGKKTHAHILKGGDDDSRVQRQLSMHSI